MHTCFHGYKMIYIIFTYRLLIIRLFLAQFSSADGYNSSLAFEIKAKIIYLLSKNCKTNCTRIRLEANWDPPLQALSTRLFSLHQSSIDTSSQTSPKVTVVIVSNTVIPWYLLFCAEPVASSGIITECCIMAFSARSYQLLLQWQRSHFSSFPSFRPHQETFFLVVSVKWPFNTLRIVSCKLCEFSEDCNSH